MAVEKLIDIITFAFCIDHSVEVNLICNNQVMKNPFEIPLHFNFVETFGFIKIDVYRVEG